MLKEEVDDQDIAEVVSSWTGIPLSRLMEGEMAKLAHLEDALEWTEEQILGEQRAAVARAARLAKADLGTGMVGEFPSLQGIMGKIYAAISGENNEVSGAIFEHYLPTSAGGPLPSTHPGAILSMADKLDTLVGCFGVGLIPTGTADPYALRRHTLGIINILLDKKYALSLSDLCDWSIHLLAEKIERPAKEIKGEVLEFFKGRVQNLLLSRVLSADAVAPF